MILSIGAKAIPKNRNNNLQIINLQQELTKYKERNEKAIEYVNFLTILKCELEMIKFNETIWGKDLLEILERVKIKNNGVRIFSPALTNQQKSHLYPADALWH